MKNIIFNLKEIGDFEKILNKVISHNIFIPINQHHFEINENIEVTFDFKGSPFLDINTLSYIAILIRSLAENNIKINIVWPSKYKGSPSAMHKYLDNTGFSRLFSESTDKSNWLKNINQEGYVYVDLYIKSQASETHYIKLNWFDKSVFKYDNEVSIWKANPVLKREFREPIEDVILKQSFIDIDDLDVFFKVIFKEIGWNIVLHSNIDPGSGFGIFGAQIINKNLMSFYFGDLGRSIPFSLGKFYDKTKYDAINQKNVSNKAAVVLFALHNDSTSRPEFPSPEDEKAFRGLALVANSLNKGSELEIISNGGKVIISGRLHRTKAQPENFLENYDYPGTFVVGSLAQSLRIKNKLSNKNMKTVEDNISLVRCYNFDGTSIDRNSFVNNIKDYDFKVNETILHLDIGYTDYGIRVLDYILIDLIKTKKIYCDHLFIWNITSDISQFQFLFDSIQKNIPTIKFIFLIYRFNKAYVIKFSESESYEQGLRKYFNVLKTENYPSDNTIYIETVAININYYIEMCTKLNTNYLRGGFNEGLKDNGFYIGDIQLLGAQNVRWFFSLTKNITQESTANMLRWIWSSICGLEKIFNRLNVEQNKILILGFSAPIRQVLLELDKYLSEKINIFSILSYDVPTREELSFILNGYSHVLLITDVISTGSLIAEIVELIQNENKEIAGIVTLVDALNIKKSFKWKEQIENKRIELISLGHIELPTLLEDDLFHEKYWIDPISQIPGERDVLSLNIDPRIERSLKLLSKKGVAKISHIVDGTRHSSVYFDLRQFLLSGLSSEIKKIVYGEIQDRLISRKWVSNFKPSAIIYPVGTSRIEKISDSDESERETLKNSVTNYYVKLIKDIWPDIEEVQVLRVFEPAGTSRCAKIVDVKKTIGSMEDLIIADDGVWSGKTFKSLLELAKSLKAKRIIFIPLLARFSNSEMLYWESINAFATGSEGVEVCFIFPLFIPIPFYNVNECPYELTIKRFEVWRDKHVIIAPLIDRVIDSLLGVDKSVTFAANDGYIGYWLKIRTYAELAAENQNALKNLVELINAANDNDKLLALIHVFLHEWHIIGRARLRQTISDPLLIKCYEIIKKRKNNTELLISTFSLLRSIFPNKYLEELGKIKLDAKLDILLLERITIHLTTFPEAIKRTRRYEKVLIDFRQSIMKASVADYNDSKDLSIRYRVILLVLNRLMLRMQKVNSHLTMRECVSELYDLILNHYTLRHETWSFIEQLTGNLNELDSNTFYEYLKKWESICDLVMSKQIFPLLLKLKEILIISTTPYNSYLSADVEYFILDDRDESIPNLEDDITIIRTNLKLLIDVPNSQLWLQGLQLSARRILESISGEKSFLIRILMSLKKVKLGSFIQEFTKEIDLRFLNRKSKRLSVLTNKIANHTILDGFIFAPSHLLESCRLNIIDNLYKYAFNGNGDKTIKREIDISINTLVKENNETSIEIIVKNNGAEMYAEAKQSESAIRLRNDLLQFGGDFPPPKSIIDGKWRVSQSIQFLLWSGSA